MGSVTVIIVELMEEQWSFPLEKPFLVYVAGNPKLRADGRTEEEAMDKLKHHILSMAGKAKSVKTREMSFDELTVQEIMNS